MNHMAKSNVEHNFEAETEVLYALRQLKGFEITLLRYAVRSAAARRNTQRMAAGLASFGGALPHAPSGWVLGGEPPEG
jgi:hypothetical protein